MNIAWIICAVLIGIASLMLHELAHGWVLTRLGKPIKEAGLGIGKPRVQVARVRGVPVYLSPWLVGAYVMPAQNEHDLHRGLSYAQKAAYAGAGVVVNLVLAAGFYATLSVVLGYWGSAVVFVLLAVALAFGWKPFCVWLMPVLALPVLVFTGWSLYYAFSHHIASGPVGFAQMLGSATSLTTLLGIGAGVNASLALFNMIPLYPLDGGRVADAVMEHHFGPRAAKFFQHGTMAVTLFVIVVVYGGDIALLFGF